MKHKTVWAIVAVWAAAALFAVAAVQDMKFDLQPKGPQ